MDPGRGVGGGGGAGGGHGRFSWLDSVLLIAADLGKLGNPRSRKITRISGVPTFPLPEIPESLEC